MLKEQQLGQSKVATKIGLLTIVELMKTTLRNWRNMMRKSILWIGCIVLLSFVGCVSSPLEIKTSPIAPNEKALGEASGSATGILLFGFIPIKQNSRFQDAYTQAIQTHPGTTRLVNPIIEEQWFWAVVLDGFIFKVTGTAVGEK